MNRRRYSGNGWLVFVSIVLLMGAPPGRAQDVNGESPEPITRNFEREDVTGTVIDQTITVIGHDFYNYFSDKWRDQGETARYNLAIFERPSARWGNLIWIEYNRSTIYRIFSTQRRADIRAQSEAAVKIVAERIADMEVRKLLFADPDVGNDEF